MLGIHKIAALAVMITVLASTAMVGAMLADGPRSDAGALDYGLDTNGNGLYDYLVVNMPYTAETADYYAVAATLTANIDVTDCVGNVLLDGYMPQPYPLGDIDAPQGYPVSYAYSVLFLEPEVTVIKLAFSGKDINRAEADGPYQVAAYVISNSGPWAGPPGPMPDPRNGQTGGWYLPTPWTYTTSSYKYTDFEPVTYAIKFTGTNSDQGIDIEGNGLYDYLRVTSEVQVNLAGGYMVSAFLTKVPDIPPDPQPRWNQTPTPGMYPGPNWLFTSYYGQVSLNEGLQTINFDFFGGDIRASELDGPYEAYLSVYYVGEMDYYGGYRNYTDPSSGVIIQGPGLPFIPAPIDPQGPGPTYDSYGDSICHRTQAYTHDQFEETPPDVVFTGEFSDKGIDWNANGLYDELQVEIGVEVLRGGFFAIHWTLSNNDGSSAIAETDDEIYLDAGKQTISTRFTGGVIRDSGIDGPYNVHVNILRVQRPRDPEANFTTSFYAHDQFERYDNSNDTRLIWLESLDVRAAGEPPDLQGAGVVTVRRGSDLMDVVTDGTVQLTIRDSNGNSVFVGLVNISIPSGGGSVAASFTFSLPSHGDYIATAELYSVWSLPSPDTMEVSFQA